MAFSYKKISPVQSSCRWRFQKGAHVLSPEESKQGQNILERTHPWEVGLSPLEVSPTQEALSSECVDGLSYLLTEGGRVLAFLQHQSLLPLQGSPEQLLSRALKGEQ